jgi:hypothetical protein
MRSRITIHATIVVRSESAAMGGSLARNMALLDDVPFEHSLLSSPPIEIFNPRVRSLAPTSSPLLLEANVLSDSKK